jgi:hypothetical protein
VELNHDNWHESSTKAGREKAKKNRNFTTPQTKVSKCFGCKMETKSLLKSTTNEPLCFSCAYIKHSGLLNQAHKDELIKMREEMNR